MMGWETLYRVTHLLANPGWVHFDLRCSTILPSCSASSADFSSAQAEADRGWDSHPIIKVSPTQLSEWVPLPVIGSTDGKIEARLSEFCQSSQRLNSLLSLRAEMKAGENMVEQFPQFVIFILVALVSLSPDNATVANLGELFLSQAVTFLIISACISFMSMIWGHLTFVAAREEIQSWGHLPVVNFATGWVG